MTAIAGVVHNGKVWIGGDSAGVAGWRITERADEKVFVKGAMVFGFCGSFRAGQLVRYKLTIPHDHATTRMEYLVGPFIDSLRQCFKDGGMSNVKDGEERTSSGFLVGYLGQLYRIDVDFQVGANVQPFDAIGCGDEFLLGSLATSTGNPKERLTKALEIAARYSGGVCGPFHIVSGGGV